MADLIDRDNVLVMLNKCKAFGKLTAKEAIRIVERQPIIEAEPVRHGRWIYDPSSGHGIKFAFCSECDETYYDKPNYCPNCGAKMDKEKNNETD